MVLQGLADQLVRTRDLRLGTICLLISTWTGQQPHPGQPLHINYRRGLNMVAQAYNLMRREAWAER